MSDSSNLCNDETLDRLVDGELSAAERRTLLKTLDSDLDGWRRCAMAFLEAQAWRADFRNVLRTPVSSKTPSVSPTAPEAFGIRQRTTPRFVGWAAMAASLLVAFWLGGMRRGEKPSGGASEQHIASANESSQPESIDSADDPNALTLWVRDESGNRRSLRVPLMEANDLDRELGVEFRPGMPVGVRQRLRNDGYHVQSRQRYAPIWLENGQRMVLPVEDTKIVPVSQNVY